MSDAIGTTPVRLTPPDWRITEAALAQAFTSRTRLVVFNNPHNPTGRVFVDEELDRAVNVLREGHILHQITHGPCGTIYASTVARREIFKFLARTRRRACLTPSPLSFQERGNEGKEVVCGRS